MFRIISSRFALALVCLAFLTTSISLAGEPAHGDAHADATHAEAGHAADGHEAAHETGLPMSFRKDLALFSLITFVIYLVVLRFGAWDSLKDGLTERERGIRQNIADAETSRLKSEAMLKEHEAKLSKVQEEVREILAEARRDADSTKQDIISTAQQEADATRQRAIADIERARDLALTELFDFVSNNVVNATETVIGRALSGDDQDRLVKDALSQMSIRNKGAV